MPFANEDADPPPGAADEKNSRAAETLTAGP